MYLKKLTLSGFKSFADPVELEFSKGVSAIVGPNGSGKSNITDAIRWVLGEQSTKSLRGKKMEDVIFSGTERKQPLNYAEVTLTLDNSEGYIDNALDEIVITRKLFRSGESEYKINHKTCKLKDILELFMDTGLGKNGYSLISQGGIENIINASPAELRSIVEEAVGIVNYKTKKQEAERKLEHTQNNLERLKDILDEIEKQLKPLKAQSEKAKEYLEVREELKKVDLMIFYANMKTSGEELKKLEKQLADTRFELFETEKQSEQKDNQFQKAREQIRVISEKTDRLQQEIEELKQAVDSSEREQLVAGGKIDSETANRIRIQEEVASHINERKNLQKDYDELAEERSSLEASYWEKVETAEGLKKERESLQADLEAEKNKQQETQKRRDAQERQRTELQENLVSLKTRYARWSTEKVFHENRIEETQKERLRIREALEDIQTEALQNDKTAERLRQEVQTVKQHLDDTEKRVDTLRNQYNVLENNHKVSTSKLEYLKNIQQNYSDYFPAIRTVMTSKKHLGNLVNNVYGPVGELLSVDTRYTVAIDVALGAKSQNIVVENVDTASQCIQILKQQRAGRATFLPMDNLRYTVVDAKDVDKLKMIEGFEGLASELVDYAPRYRRVVESLLGKILVTTNFKTGRNVQKAIHSRYTVVTMEGEIFYPGGAIVGGESKKSKQSPLFKKAEIEKLEYELKQQTREKEKVAAEGLQTKEALKRLQEQHHKALLRLNSVEQEAWRIEQNKKDLEAQLLEYDKMDEALQGDASNYLKREEALKQAINEEEQKLSMLEESFKEEVESSSEYIEVIRDGIENLNRKISEERIELAKNNENIKSYDQQMTMVKEQIDTLDRRIERNQNDLKNCLTSIENLQRQCDTLKTTAEGHRAAILEKEAFLNDLAKTTETHQESSEKLEQEIKDLNHKIILLNEAKNNAEIAYNKLDMQMNHWEETIFDNYDMNFVMVEDIYSNLSKEDLDLTPENQRRLKGRIAAMGNVNVNAIEEYVALNERHGFMNGQYQDMIKAKEELETIIDNLYHSMEKQFAQKFMELQKIFSKVFSILFEGGRARIDYTDPENVLESGIELTAQPPGKNLRHISLLSGGEKSMIAIALLFSFLELNPSPFCVIDEIDAALDDSNIYRFTAYLEHIAKDNQFIVITHRKSTLEACDAIYGVSMAKNGISKLVSVRLSDYVEPTA